MFKNVEEYAWAKKRQAVYNYLKTLNYNYKVRVLDIGCNNGGQLEEYSKLVYGEFIGIDVKEFSEWHHLDYDFIICDARNLPFRDEVFDIVISTEVIEHFIEGEIFLSEVYRILKRGGILILTTPNRLRFYMLHKNLLAVLTKKRFVSGFTDEHLREYSPNELADILESIGFQVERIEYIAFSPYLMTPLSIYKLLDSFSDRFFKKILKWDMMITARKN